ncbi:MAG TPA: helix-hairpin-helix domain-containing protein [Nitrospiraceae bacterium]|nr:helix-hairpin-helix domain-containing protein [Nitrospiraceae bacterium]
MEIDPPSSAPGRSITLGRSLLIKLVLFAGATGAISWLSIQTPPPLSSPEHGPPSPDPIVVTLPREPVPPSNSMTVHKDQTAPPANAQTARTDAQPRAGRSAGANAASPTAREPLAHRLDLNRATQVELEQLPGIGPGLAKRILDYKQSHGRYRTVEELREVKGIGEKRWRKLEPLLTVVTTAPPAPSGPRKGADHKNGQT